MSKTKNLPLTLDEVLSCSETVMMQEAKVALIAMVKRQRRVGHSMALPIPRAELCAKLGMDPATGLEAIRQLVKLDYLHREGDNVQMVIGHPVVQALEVGELKNVPAEELKAKVDEILGRNKEPDPVREAKVARAVGREEKPEPKEQAPAPSVLVPQSLEGLAAEGNPKGGAVEPEAKPTPSSLDEALNDLEKRVAKKRSSKKRSKKS